MTPRRRYGLLLLCYPRSYRLERAEEMLEVLLARDAGAGTWSRVAEGVSLVRHGLGQRLRHTSPRRHDYRSWHLAGASLLCLLAVLGGWQLLATGLRGLRLDGYPDEWQAGALWVDPRWPVHALWLVTGLAFVLRRQCIAVTTAWTAGVLHIWLFLSVTSPASLPWLGDTGPHWVARGGAFEASWLVLSLAGALLIGGTAAAQRARHDLPGSRWCGAIVIGLIGGAAISVVALSVAEQSPNGLTPLLGVVAGPSLAPVLCGAVLGLGLIRVPHGRPALALISVLAAVPLAARWSEAVALLAAGVVVFLAGYAVASLSQVPDAATDERAQPLSST